MNVPLSRIRISDFFFTNLRLYTSKLNRVSKLDVSFLIQLDAELAKKNLTRLANRKSFILLLFTLFPFVKSIFVAPIRKRQRVINRDRGTNTSNEGGKGGGKERKRKKEKGRQGSLACMNDWNSCTRSWRGKRGGRKRRTKRTKEKKMEINGLDPLPPSQPRGVESSFYRRRCSRDRDEGVGELARGIPVNAKKTDESRERLGQFASIRVERNASPVKLIRNS